MPIPYLVRTLRTPGAVPELARTWRLLTPPELRQTPRVRARLDLIVKEVETPRPGAPRRRKRGMQPGRLRQVLRCGVDALVDVDRQHTARLRAGHHVIRVRRGAGVGALVRPGRFSTVA